MARTTIKDIARIAGVSVTTVSRALNDAPEIRPETRERILRICREQGFRINYLARSLVSSRTHVLGVVLPDLSGPFHAALSLHLERYGPGAGLPDPPVLRPAPATTGLTTSSPSW